MTPLQLFRKAAFNSRAYYPLVKQLLIICNTGVLVLYIMLHFIFFDFPFELWFELISLAKIIAVTSLFALLPSAAIIAADSTEWFIKNIQQAKPRIVWKPIFTIVICLIIINLGYPSLALPTAHRWHTASAVPRRHSECARENKKATELPLSFNFPLLKR